MPNLCSVICVSYNHAKFAADGLQSIFDQTYKNIEIIVLDDGSTDDTAKVISEKLKQSPFPAKFITQKNTGNVPGNFNTAMEQASGEFLTFLSLDDLLLPGCISSRMNLLRSDEKIVFAADTRYLEVDDTGAITADGLRMPVTRHKIETAHDLLEAEYQEIDTFYIQGQVFRRDAVKAVGGFDDTMTGDDIILRTKLFRYMTDNPDLRFHLGDAAVFAYRKHDSNLHKQSFRQVKTVIEWKEAFFPDRPYPKMFFLWLENFFHGCIQNDRDAELRHALAYNPVIAAHFETFRQTWKIRRRLLKSWIRRSVGLSRSPTPDS